MGSRLRTHSQYMTVERGPMPNVAESYGKAKEAFSVSCSEGVERALSSEFSQRGKCLLSKRYLMLRRLC